ncbi:MAG: FHIPEP family type III secretion protein, partial [Polyangiaceae bacterium]
LLFVASRASTRRREAPEAGQTEPVQHGDDEAAPPRFVPVVTPWSIELSADLTPLLDDDTRGGELRRAGIRAAAAATREVLFRELGVPLPAARVSVNEELPDRSLVVSLLEVPARALSLPRELADNEVAPYVVEQSLAVLRPRAADYLGISETQTLLDQLEQVAPATVRQVVPKPISVTLLADVLRRLVEEGVSIRDLRGVLEALSQVGNAERDPLNLAEYVRSQLRRAITHQLTGGSGELEVLLLDGMIEDTVRGAISRTAAGSFLTLAPAAARDLVQAVRRAHASADSPGVVLLTQPDVRRFVRKLVEVELPELRVVSFAELLPEIAIQPRGKASLVTL